MSGSRLLADWGTTARRAWLVDGGGTVIAATEDGQGLIAIGPDGWQTAFDGLKQALGGDPDRALLAGMVGSRQGWQETPYLPCPVAPEDLAAALVTVGDRVAIVPGVSFRSGDVAEVMRGEETQVLGALAAGLMPSDALACLPGTHTKWIALRGGRIAEFRTVMTGELFAAIKGMATLTPHVGDVPGEGADFDAGLDQSLSGETLPAALFGLRAHALLGTGQRGSGAAYLSGLLIGADVRAGLALAEDRMIHVIGRTDLAALYAAAIRRGGGEARTLHGGAAALAGLTHLAELAA